MKQLIIILTVLITTITMAQEKNTISLNERVRFLDKNPAYQASVVVSTYYANYGKSSITATQLIDGFKEKLTQSEIDLSQVKKDEIGYITLSLGKEGMLYHFKTNSKEDALKFANTNALGSSRLSYDYVAKLDPDEEAEIIKKAIDKARNRASGIAGKMNKNLGEIIKLETNYDGDEWIRGIFRDTAIGELVFDIEIDFELLD
ncbi:hypothetical protein [Spongiivirga citrea]|uniref:DUF541 domain-containing protein n=1 Tax=Spongiivirga citrea TaxID=1481457 RepID=A0A6M0CHS3_9FLAO|nr:hypothetical protein [Spongiivirga citrea]NER17072.1 hypothetical protein [Spongiivirga citrea]